MKTLLIVPGQFICLTVSEVFVSLLSITQTGKLFDALALADNTPHPVKNRHYVFKRVFNSEVVGILPAFNTQALLDYAENYKGLHTDRVRGIAACILTGTPYSLDSAPHDDPNNGGTKVKAPRKPVKPRPGGAAIIPATSQEA